MQEEATTIDNITEGAQSEAAARSATFRALASALSFPWQDFHRAVLDGEIRETLAECVAALPYKVEDADALIAGLAEAESDYDLFQSDYVGLFDVGAGGPPCPLYGGAWGGDRQKVMEEALRFYRFFGLTISEKERDLPDHICAQLEFLHFLTFKETETVGAAEDPASLRRAARDFLVRHPLRWLPKARAKLDKREAPPLWRSLVGLATAVCEADSVYLVASEGPVKD